ncbi:uncharacterized protein si:dkeyp-72g9.4 isoform X2 [Kryptolebias marmoratus]|nr:uncharacterized protein si:dkeyp-72g9.4 isoform X2 [Kryptolebias marmoratus]
MRPRSRLPTKRRILLPTITEGTEETARDWNDPSTFQLGDGSQGVSSEDYLLSICHLARPTFPTREGSPEHLHAQQQDAVQQRLRPSRVITLTSPDFDLKEEQEDGKELNGRLMRWNSDPLEFLYGDQNNLFALSGSVGKAFVRGRSARQHGSEARVKASSPDFPCQRKGSCPEIVAGANPPVPNGSPQHSSFRSEVRRVCPEGERLKQSFISQWISDCRSAWREARVRACMLPAIAEV